MNAELQEIKIEVNDAAMTVGGKVTPLNDVLAQLDAGKFDAEPHEGLARAMALMVVFDGKGEQIPVKDRITLWRWIVSAVFALDCAEHNGFGPAQHRDGRITHEPVYVNDKASMPVTPYMVRLALSVHAEGSAVQMFGSEKAPAASLHMFRRMIDFAPHGGFVLSAFGREGLSILFNGFLDQMMEGDKERPTVH